MANPVLESFRESLKACVANSSRPPEKIKGKENPDLPSVFSNYWPPNVALSSHLSKVQVLSITYAQVTILKLEQLKQGCVHQNNNFLRGGRNCIVHAFAMHPLIDTCLMHIDFCVPIKAYKSYLSFLNKLS